MRASVTERIEPIEQASRLMHSPLAGAVGDLWQEVGPHAKRMEKPRWALPQRLLPFALTPAAARLAALLT
ncbi:hypothetical protein [Xylella fastidiosa]|uniref:hypothetical protein n=1 Tax=Xylella fastidiosa TaxID=2371 RepID=UPI0039847E3C